ncbi:hypothetical protein MVEN_00705400 [Mycena venus]|uniref:Zn(2)-C6 fungal-type domain-containing protein n=1 Tax=Mycena venus TaxID=2733690 RepID=A0A8H7D579_9AGAR|nr:hypothetical protein MVEN_00705400 [Mycena venus]
MSMTDFAGLGESSSALTPVHRGPKACTNCRRRKIKCDGARPLCSQCRLRPPRSKEPCQYPRPDSQQIAQEGNPTQMLETIAALRNRIEELEYLNTPDPSRIYLNQPYESGSSGSRSPDLPDLSGLNFTQSRATPSPANMPEPPSDLVASLVDGFLERFANSGYFFFNPSQFRQSALLPLPFGHRDRPSPALLSAAYLWGSVLSHISHAPYTPDAFLTCVLQNIPQDLMGIVGNPQLVLDTIQAEVLLSFYYLHTARSVQGRYHASAACSIALGANLHLVRSPQHHAPFPPFTLQTSLPLLQNAAEEATRVDAFWAVVIINNLWAGAEGSPSPVPYAINIDSPWPSSSRGGATITKFLNGNDEHGSSAVARLAKAHPSSSSALSPSQHAQSENPTPPPSPRSTSACTPSRPPSLPLPGAAHILVLTHALVDLAIVRLHAPYTRTSESARAKCLAAAARVVVGVGAVNILDGARNTDPMLGSVYAGVASIYINEIMALRQHGGSRSPRAQAQARELETRLGTLMSAMASLAAYSPLIERCFVDMRTAYAAMSVSG